MFRKIPAFRILGHDNRQYFEIRLTKQLLMLSIKYFRKGRYMDTSCNIISYIEKSIFKIFAKFTEKHLCLSLFL